MKKGLIIIILILIFLIFVVPFFSYALNEKDSEKNPNKKKELSKGNSNKKGSNEKPRGYIIELKEPPLSEKWMELTEDFEATINSITTYAIKEVNKKNSNSTKLLIKKHKKMLADSRNKSIQKILQKLKKKGLNKITGNVIEESLELNVLAEYENIFNGFALDISSKEAEELKSLPEVKNIYPNNVLYLALMDSIPSIKADKVWELDQYGSKCDETEKDCLTGKNITIGIIDTGIDYTHPDLGGCFGPMCKVIGGYDFINIDFNPKDDNGHGTHVAAIAAGNGTLKGVAPDAKLYSYKSCNFEGECVEDDILESIEKSVDPNNDGDFSDHIDILTMSFGGDGNPDDLLSRAVDTAVEIGVIAVAAAGNKGPEEQTISSPGTSRKAITVGAYDDSSNYTADFSSRGPIIWQNDAVIKPDILAPGVRICSARFENVFSYNTCLDNYYINLDGTSMAVPHVAGAAALIKQKHKQWSQIEIKLALRNTAIRINDSIYAQGYGRINVLKAVSLEHRPPISLINTSGKVDESTKIIGTAFSANFVKYNLSYVLMPDSINWTLICLSTNPVFEGVLCENFHTGLLPNGTYILKLVVYGGGEVDDNQKSEDNAIINVTNTFSEKEGIVGDLNNDEMVNIFDLIKIITIFYSECSNEIYDSRADLNNDCIINIFDIIHIIKFF